MENSHRQQEQEETCGAEDSESSAPDHPCMSPSSKGSPHSGQNLGGCAGSAGSQPHLSHLYWGTPAGFFAPHSAQNFPLFTAPQEQVQPSAAGLGLPHSGQNFPVTVAPHSHRQLSAAGLGSGFLLPQLGQKLPVTPLCPQEQVQPLGAAGADAGGGERTEPAAARPSDKGSVRSCRPSVQPFPCP